MDENIEELKYAIERLTKELKHVRQELEVLSESTTKLAISIEDHRRCMNLN